MTSVETAYRKGAHETADRDANLKALERMATLAGAAECVIPGHDPLVFVRFPAQGRIAKVK